MQLTAAWPMAASGDSDSSNVGAQVVTPDRRDEKSCAVCGRPDSPFGFGPPLTRVFIWACLEHREQVDRRLMSAQYEAPDQPAQPSLF